MRGGRPAFTWVWWLSMCLCKEAELDELVLLWLSSSSDPECVTVEAHDQKKQNKTGGQSIKTSPREHGERKQARGECDTATHLNGLFLRKEKKSVAITPGEAARRSPVTTLALIYFPHFVATLFHTALWGQMNVGYFKASKWQPFSYLYNYHYSSWNPMEQLCPFYYPQKKNP